jgi:hypothetical protein
MQVHLILWNDWDPIGVNDYGVDDEYDSYVGPIIDKISKGETVDQIASYLDWLVFHHMQMSGSGWTHVRHRELATKLITLQAQHRQ